MMIRIGSTLLRNASFAITLALILSCAKTGAEIHLIPDLYVGPVVIVYGVPNGSRFQRDQHGITVYSIGADGMLGISEDKPAPGFYQMTYYYLSADGRRSEIPYHKDDQGSLQVFADVDGSAGNGADAVRFTAYLIGVPNSRTGAVWHKIRERAVQEALDRFTSGSNLPKRSAMTVPFSDIKSNILLGQERSVTLGLRALNIVRGPFLFRDSVTLGQRRSVRSAAGSPRKTRGMAAKQVEYAPLGTVECR